MGEDALKLDLATTTTTTTAKGTMFQASEHGSFVMVAS